MTNSLAKYEEEIEKKRIKAEADINYNELFTNNENEKEEIIKTELKE